MWKRLVGKTCKIVLKDGGEVYAVFGEVIDANSSFIVNKERLGRLHFVAVDTVKMIHEVGASGKSLSQTQNETQKDSKS